MKELYPLVAEEPFYVFIKLKEFQRMMAFASLCDFEINGMGIVEQEENQFTITKVFLVPQVTQTDRLEVAFDNMGFNRFVYRFVKNGGDPAKLKLQWHSHAQIEAFFSPEDKRTINNFMGDLMISMVVNKAGETCCRVDVFNPLRRFIEVYSFIKLPAPDDSLIEQCQKEIAENVKIERGGRKYPINERRNNKGA